MKRLHNSTGSGYNKMGNLEGINSCDSVFLGYECRNGFLGLVFRKKK